MDSGDRHEGIVQAVTLFGTDTVLSALALMERYGLSQAPVVDDTTGDWLGDISEEELYRVWAIAPLARMGTVLAAREVRNCTASNAGNRQR